MARTAAQIKAEIKDIRDKYDQIFARASKDGDIPQSDADEMVEMDVKLEALTEEYSQRAQDERRAKSNRDAMSQIFASDETPQEVTDGVKALLGDDGDKIVKTKAEFRDIGKRLVEHPEFAGWLEGLTGGGTRTISDNMSVKSPVITLDSNIREMSALITGLSSTSGGALVVNDRRDIIVPLGRDDLRVVDLLTRMSTSSDSVEFVRVTTETNNAAPTAEATSGSDGDKPESAVAMAIVTEIVETIAHWIPITRRAASDARQIMSYVNDFLMWGLLDALNDQIINGTGTTPQLRGLDDLSNTQSQAFDTDILTTTRKARTKVRTVGKATPTAYVMSPENWEEIDLLQDNEARYIFGGPQRMGSPMLWGLPVVEEEVVAADQGFVGDWRMGIIFDREQAQIYMTDSHSDFFIRNILVLLAEMRAAIAWLKPAAFVEITLGS